MLPVGVAGFEDFLTVMTFMGYIDMSFTVSPHVFPCGHNLSTCGAGPAPLPTTHHGIEDCLQF